MFGDERRREINLGGTRSLATQQSVLAQVRHEREQRLLERKRLEASSIIQTAWRAHAETCRTRNELLERFDQEPVGTLTSTRLLLFGGGESRRLLTWTTAALGDGNAFMQNRFLGPDAGNWLVLLKQLSSIILKQVTNDPLSPNAAIYLKFLNTITAKQPTNHNLSNASTSILQDLINKELYLKISYCIQAIPTKAKTSATALPGLVTLCITPLQTFPPNSSAFSDAFKEIAIHILTIPHLPNRLPIASLTTFASHVPLGSFHLISPLQLSQSISENINVLHLLANLFTFMPIRYSAMTSPALIAYIELLNKLIGRLPVGAFELQKKKTSDTMDWAPQSDSDDERPNTLPKKVEEIPSVSPPDTQTAKKLRTLVSSAHTNALLTTANKNPTSWVRFVELVVLIGAKWPKEREGLLTTIVVSHGNVVLKQLWRDSVRVSQLGRENEQISRDVNDFRNDWPPFLLLTELYTQALLTMGDDEFFSTQVPTRSKQAATSVGARNPFSVGEVIELSRRLLNIVFPLYWNEAPKSAGEMPISWELVRERITKCLQAIHTRDSRRPFTPPGHWLVIDQSEVRSFVDAAIAEEQKLDDEDITRQLTKRELAYLSPRLGILNNIPFAIPFESRVSIFRSFIRNDRFKMDNIGYGGAHLHRNKVIVRRDHVSQDGFDHLNELGVAWKGRLAITFVDKFGQEEAGIDGGGVFKEFLTSLSREVFDTNRGLWFATKQQELYPNSHSYASEPHQLNWYRFIGRVLGKALYEGILVDVSFAGFFLAKWLGKQSFLDDLASLDPELYQGLIFLKNYAGNPEELSLDFTISEEDLGVTRTVELKPNGSNIPVTKANRLEYIILVAHYRLTKQIKKQSEAFFEGLSELIEPRWLRMFNQQELQVLVGGAEEPIDIDDLRSNVVYGGLYDEDHETIRMFWRVVKSMDENSRRLLLRFVTSCARPPLLGFKELNPKFALRDAGIDTARLPTASTCVNLLKLPLYRDEETLRRKLLHAINSGAGFDLS
ncbi:hypothetical protein M408DRAFT_329093 [Serendipita vermifera MAFF 305830]|uniref:HECT-type E3 ubiquitin transferase n=1 Tax=Serendipita vermifera MAFF 305830 TaxID=933852 RepID=A0A0C2WSG8_SERVB|nr:hypothetical protein M408DRAFT_329093 [Serendipita vermifera MAFF 305830]